MTIDVLDLIIVGIINSTAWFIGTELSKFFHGNVFKKIIAKGRKTLKAWKK
jgi:hypothetical protein